MEGPPKSPRSEVPRSEVTSSSGVFSQSVEDEEVDEGVSQQIDEIDEAVETESWDSER